MEKKHIELTHILDVTPHVQEAIRTIRNEENVRRWMYTDHLISEQEHQNWLELIRENDSMIPFVVFGHDDSPIGLVSLNSINRSHQRADWAYYVTESAKGGIGAIIEYAFIDFVFENCEIEKLNCEVIEGNNAVVKLHKKFLFNEEGFRESNILKDDTRLGVHFMGLTKEAWSQRKSDVWSKYARIFEATDVVVNWPRSSTN